MVTDNEVNMELLTAELNIYGEGGATEAGVDIAKNLLEQEYNYSAIALEIVASGETQNSPYRI